MRDLRQVHLVHDRAGALELSGGRLDRGLHFRSRDVGEMSAQQSHSQALHVAGERCAVVGHRQNARGRVGRIVAGDGAEHQRAVPSGARHRAHVIHRPREREYAGSAHAAVGRLEPGDAAERGRDPDRSTGVGAERARRQTGRDGRAGARGRPAGDAVSVCAPGVTRVAVVRVDALGPVRELVHVELAEHDRARSGQPGHDGRIRGRHRVGCRPPGHARRREHSEQVDVDTLRRQAAGQGAFEHRPREPRVATDGERCAGSTEHARRRPPEGEHQLGRQLDIGDTANPVGAELQRQENAPSAWSTAEPCGPSSARTSCSPSHGRRA